MRIVPFLLIGIAVCIVFIGVSNFTPTHVIDSNIKHTGPVKVVKAIFDYHQTLQYPDGRQFEFYHCQYTAAFDEGDTVDVSYTGDGRSMGDCASNVMVTLVTASREHHAKLIEADAQKLLGDAGYYNISVYEDVGANNALAQKLHARTCDLRWNAIQLSTKQYTTGVMCDSEDGKLFSFVTDRI